MVSNNYKVRGKRLVLMCYTDFLNFLFLGIENIDREYFFK